jgi:hypothetical protein
MEMLRDAYPQANEVAPGIYDRIFPLAANLIRPLGEFEMVKKELPEPESAGS